MGEKCKTGVSALILAMGREISVELGDFALILAEEWEKSVKLAFPHLFWPWGGK